MATAGGPRASVRLADKRFVSTYPYTAARRTTDDAVALALPEVDANTMASCCSIKPDGTVRRRSRCRWEEPSTASKGCIFLFFTSCPGLTGVID
jgi:hypothetical protein